jgi:diaminobutyrate-2-oxoglutarate transaminase
MVQAVKAENISGAEGSLRVIVQKYGGSSVSTATKLRAVAEMIKQVSLQNRIVAVVSAMGDSTDNLLELARQVGPALSPRELDMLLSTGETVSAALLSLAIQSLGVKAVSLSASQSGIITNEEYSNARILEVRPDRIKKELAGGAVVVVPGFQGVTKQQEITTLGRGGSDTSAAAIAAALGAESCEIYTDVKGVYSADPRVVPEAIALSELGAGEMQELAWHGAQVVKAEAVEFARTNGVAVVVRSAFADGPGTLIPPESAQSVYRPHRPEVAAVTGRKDLVYIRLDGSALTSPQRDEVFAALSKYDLIFGGLNGAGETSELFISNLEIPDPNAFAAELAPRFNGAVKLSGELGAVSLVGFGLGSRPAALLEALKVLEEENVLLIKSFTGRESLTFVIPRPLVDASVKRLHRIFVESREPALQLNSFPLIRKSKGSNIVDTFELLESEVRYYCRDFPVVFTKGIGCRLFDENGGEYLDFFSGAGTLNYGHNNPRLKRRLIEYIENDSITHSLDMATAVKREFLERFDSLILAPRRLRYKIQFCGPTGTNAVEAALKLARKVTGRQNVIFFMNAYHGLSLGSLAVTGNASKRTGAGVPLHYTMPMPYDGDLGPNVNTLDYFEAFLQEPGSGMELPAAVIVETIQAEGGVKVASYEWLHRLEDLTRRHGIVFIVDDIQVGCGRTGSFFSFEDAGLRPDLVCLSKAISGFGLPMALLLIRPELDVWQPGEHTGTFRGNNLAFVTASEALAYWEDEAFAGLISKKSALMSRLLKDTVERHPEALGWVRGRGLIQGLGFDVKGLAHEVARVAFDSGLIIETSGARSEVVKLLPPLTIDEDELRDGIARLDESLTMALRGMDLNRAAVSG